VHGPPAARPWSLIAPGFLRLRVLAEIVRETSVAVASPFAPSSPHHQPHPAARAVRVKGVAELSRASGSSFLSVLVGSLVRSGQRPRTGAFHCLYTFLSFKLRLRRRNVDGSAFHPPVLSSEYYKEFLSNSIRLSLLRCYSLPFDPVTHSHHLPCLFSTRNDA
jgi:hypothetical protein